ncbi:MAG TPA: hypothetical protein VK616_00290 [Flavitalea sp.]|nr:hypothetical protein [Flavitalea sp.]
MKAIFLVVINVFSYCAYCQNLVPNYSFEDENICERNERCNPSGWFDVSQQPHGYRFDETPGASGSRWINVITGNRVNTKRQYWQTILLNKLEKGKKYRISLCINGWEAGPYPMDIGLYFTDSMLSVPSGTLIQPQNYIGFTDAKFKELKGGWFRLQKDYIATDDNQVLVVGNFSTKDYQEIAKQRETNSIYISIKVDNVEVVPIEKISCNNCIKVKDSLYSLTRRHSPAPIRDTFESAPLLKKSQKMPEEIDSINLKDLFFDFGSYRIKSPDMIDEYRPMFTDSLISKILVIGYTDDVGSGEKNLKLSEMRASLDRRIHTQLFSRTTFAYLK